MEALGHAVGKDDDGPATLDAGRRWYEGRLDAQNLWIEFWIFNESMCLQHVFSLGIYKFCLASKK